MNRKYVPDKSVTNKVYIHILVKKRPIHFSTRAPATALNSYVFDKTQQLRRTLQMTTPDAYG